MIAKTLSAKILFPFDSDRLTDEAIEQLKAIAVALSF
jgi:outer membrane protein OmpA-like peptidoglycan-associated protein